MERMGGATLICFPPQLLILTQMANFEMSDMFDRMVKTDQHLKKTPWISHHPDYFSESNITVFFSKCKGDQMSLY